MAPGSKLDRTLSLYLPLLIEVQSVPFVCSLDNEVRLSAGLQCFVIIIQVKVSGCLQSFWHWDEEKLEPSACR
jgi:hypothetical protein